MTLKDTIRERARDLGFQAVGFTCARDLESTEQVLLQRIDAGLMGGLDWFTPARARLSCHPQELLPGARSVVALAASYRGGGPSQRAACEAHVPRGRVARYAWGPDYHDVLRARLRDLVEGISSELGYRPGARIFVDSSPLPEREVARQSGLGWFGKNTNILVHGLGSWVFLAAILLDIDLPEDAPVLTHCGSCDLCIRACPTGALIDQYTLDNRRCISYQTIENRGSIPHELRPLMGDWVYGCDICQDVCPVNHRWERTGETRQHGETFPACGADEAAGPRLDSLLLMTAQEYQQRFRGSAMKRAKRRGLQRNAAVAMGNSGNTDAVEVLEEAYSSPEAVVRSHVAWAMGRLGGLRARRRLETARRREPEPGVRLEIERALERSGE